ncbi:dihydrolipoyl dehydrogenase family protein [Hoyosella rhizosphaerae]|uniref:Oxidoreductase n=1 Tax=Hoyosella rhizosphaerae TaxID=1755582 RepID=A0A916XDK1_9ACTN|nr:FAD-dependent oxidoreductase [Hoyosella rhizosphaerae]GGC62762.1 oxidoreductase [Hoyosella rhizosphaerae]
MTQPQPWDLLVVGGGSAGIVSAKTAVKLGASVLLVESHRTGGDCLWTGCVPSKSLLAAAHHVAHARRGAEVGVHVGDITVDFAAVMAHVRSAISTIEPIDTPEALEADGITVVSGRAVFTSPHTADVNGKSVRFRQALIATGAAPILPPIPGLNNALTSETVWDLDELPARLLVIGGGSIGCELSQAFARLGSDVTLVEAGPRVLPAESPAASRIINDVLEHDGVTIHTGQSVSHIEGTRAVLSNDDTVEFDQVLVAVGRAARTDKLGLDAAGVRVNDHKQVMIDRHLRTTNPRIWAAGDVTPLPQFTHTAGTFGSLAASNAVLGIRRKVNTALIPRVTFTDPEVASVGESTPTVNSRLREHTVTHDHLDRAVTENSTRGFSSLVFDRKSRLVGATVVSPRAGETIGELTLAMKLGLRSRDLAGTIHPYPTYNDGAWNAAIADTRDQLASPAAKRTFSVLTGIRRKWLKTKNKSV